jgi:hypothetical protein
MRRVLITMLSVALVVQAGAAFAYIDTGSDPEDAGGGFLDFRSSVRRVRTDDAGRRWLRVKFTSYGRWEFTWRVRVLLDSRGGPRYDYQMTMWDFDQSGRRCDVRPRSGRPGELVSGMFVRRESDSWAPCRVRLGAVHPTKRVRWRLASSEENKRRIVDHAPGGYQFYR